MCAAIPSPLLALNRWLADTILALRDIVGFLPLVNDVIRVEHAARVRGSRPEPAACVRACGLLAENGNCTAIVHVQIHRGPDGGKTLLCARPTGLDLQIHGPQRG